MRPLITHRFRTHLAYVYDLATRDIVARVSGYSRESVEDYIYKHPDLNFKAGQDGVFWGYKPDHLHGDSAYLDMRLFS